MHKDYDILFCSKHRETFFCIVKSIRAVTHKFINYNISFRRLVEVLLAVFKTAYISSSVNRFVLGEEGAGLCAYRAFVC